VAAVKRNKGGTKQQAITAWSYSRLSTYDTCAYLAKLMYVDKHQQPESPAMRKGKRAHTQAENFVKGEGDYPDHPSWEGADWEHELQQIKDLGYDAELQAAFDVNWKKTSWFGRSAWARMMVDASKYDSKKKYVHCIDYKTGRIAAEHGNQAELYAIAMIKHYTRSEYVDVDYWYLDQGEIQEYHFEKDDVINELLPKWEEKAYDMCDDRTYEPNPGRQSCGKYGGCPFAANKGGQCTYNTTGELA